MTLRWDLLLPTKTTLIRERDPTIADADYDYAVIWVNKLTNSAWLLKDSTMQVLPPTTGTVVDVATAPTISMTELETTVDNLQKEIDDEMMRKSVYDTDESDIVDEAEAVDGGSF